MPLWWAWVVVLLVGWGCGRGTRPGGSSAEGLLYVRFHPVVGADLWVQSLDGQRHRPLTDSGRVEPNWRGAPVDRMRGAAISPEHRRVAYVERAFAPRSSSGQREVSGWDGLFVVNADGTQRRKLVELSSHPSLPRERVLSGEFLWSDDGSQLLFVLSRLSAPPEPERCWQASFWSVDVATGEVSAVSPWRTLGRVTLLHWRRLEGEVSLYAECPPPIEEGLPRASFTSGVLGVLQVGTGAVLEHTVFLPQVSLDGRLAFLPYQVRPGTAPIVLSTQTLKPSENAAIPLPVGQQARFVWLNHARAALVTMRPAELFFQECGNVFPASLTLAKWEADSKGWRVLREDSPAFEIVAISPDDDFALVSFPTGEVVVGFICSSRPLEVLHLVRRDALEGAVSVQQLRKDSVQLTRPSERRGYRAFSTYLGWVR